MGYRDGEPRVTMLDRCRELRRGSTDAERVLWRSLRGSQLGAKFRRQHEFGPFILDFFCAEHSLAVEVDGSQHLDASRQLLDEERTRYLTSRGIRLLRFTNSDVLLEPLAALESIRLALRPPSP